MLLNHLTGCEIMKVFGIDVSRHNGLIDWQRVAAAGVKFAMIRAGFGSSLANKDMYADYNFKNAAAAGIETGAYWFSYALSEEGARREAQNLMEVVSPYRLTYPLCFDYEYDSVRYAISKNSPVGPAIATAYANAFLSELENNKYYAMNYSNRYFLQEYFNMNVLKKYDLWYALWGDTLDRSDAGIWQFSATGQVDGISGDVDLDYAFRDYPEIMRKNGLNGFTKPIPHWAQGAYDYLHDKTGFILYDLNFNRIVTMGEVIEIIARLSGYEPIPNQPDWAERAYRYLHDKTGFTLYDTNLSRILTMGELLEILARLDGYVPEPNQPDWAENAYNYLREKTGFVLYDKNYSREVTMGEFISILARLDGYQPE